MNSAETCTACSDLCATCTSDTVCQTCVANGEIASSSTMCTCIVGYGKQLQTCKVCPALCHDCTEPTSCTNCNPHTYMDSNGKCNCNTNFYISGNLCIAVCDKLCATCSADNGSICSTCITNAELSSSTCSCTANSVYNTTS